MGPGIEEAGGYKKVHGLWHQIDLTLNIGFATYIILEVIYLPDLQFLHLLK